MKPNRILLKLARPGDAQRIVEAIEVSTLQNLSFFSGKRRLTVEEERAYLEKIASDPSQQLYLIVRKDDGRLLGTVGLHDIDAANRNARLGISIFRAEDRGNGYATEALETLIALAFTMWKLGAAGNTFHKLYLNVFIENERAKQLYARIGFKKDGILRQHYLLNGEWHDMVHMSLFKSEWEELRQLDGYNLEPSA